MALRLTIEYAGVFKKGEDIQIIAAVLIILFLGLAWRFLVSIDMLDKRQKEAQESAQEWYELMNYIIQHDPSAIAVHNNELRYIFVSERYLNDHKVKEKDIIGKHHYEVFPEIPEKWRDVHRRALAGEVLGSDDDYFIREDGSVEYTRWQCRPWRKSDGSIGGIILYTEVITERKLIELKLRKTANQLSMVLEHAGDGIYAVDGDGKAVLINSAALKMLGYEEHEIIGRVMHDNHHHSRIDLTSYPHDECPISLSFQKGESHIISDEVFWRKDGTSFPVEYVASPIREDGRITGAVVSFRDITVRKKAEEEISRLNKQLFQLIETIKELSIAENLNQVQSIVAASTRKLTNAQGAAFVLRDGEFCHYVEEDTLEPLWKGEKFPMARCITGWVMLNRIPAVINNIYNDERIPVELYENTFVKSLAVFPVNSAAPKAAFGSYWSSFYEPSEEELRLLQTLADAAGIAMENITLFKDLEDRVEERTMELRILNRELEAFSYSVSHDLRAPLRGISGFANMLQEKYATNLDNEGKRICSVIVENVKKMSQLIDDLLTFSRLARKDIKKSHINMKIMVHSIYYELTDEAQREGITFNIDDLDDCNGDPNMMRQVLANLISNAVKFTSKTVNPEITVSSRREGDFIVYSIRDNGAGFNNKFREKLFGVFQRLHGVSDFEGTGVGLAIVERIVHRHGGEVDAEGETGKGAVFSFSIPDSVLCQDENMV